MSIPQYALFCLTVLVLLLMSLERMGTALDEADMRVSASGRVLQERSQAYPHCCKNLMASIHTMLLRMHNRFFENHCNHEF